MLNKCLLPSLALALAGLVCAQDADPVLPTISQIAVGGTWRTTIVLINTTSLEAPFKLRFRNSQGNPLLLDWQKVTATSADPSVYTGELEGVIPKFGLVMYRSVSQPSVTTQTGYAQLVEGTGIAGQAIFQQVQPNGSVYAAAAPLTMPLKQFILPVDNTIGSITAVALANPSRGENYVDIYARRAAGGSAMEEPTRLLTAWQHRAETVDPFFSDTLRNIYGVADVNARGVPLGALGLRFLRDNGPFTSFDPVDKEPWSPVLRTRPTIAQIVSGGTWNTTLLFVNIQPIPTNFKIEFRDSAGQPLVLPWENKTPSTILTPAGPNELAGTIPAGGMVVFQTTNDPSGAVRQGYARLAEGNLTKGQAIFSQATASGARYEAASPLRLGSAWILVPFDSVGSETGIAIANTTAIQTTGTVRITNEDGNLIGQTQIGMRAYEHKAGTIGTLFPELAEAVKGKRGVIEIVSLPSELHALGLRFEGEFFTSFPVILMR